MTIYEFLVPIVLFVAFWAVYLILRAQVRKHDRGE